MILLINEFREVWDRLTFQQRAKLLLSLFNGVKQREFQTCGRSDWERVLFRWGQLSKLTQVQLLNKAKQLEKGRASTVGF